MITTKNEEIKKLELQSTLPLKRKLQNESKL